MEPERRNESSAATVYHPAAPDRLAEFKARGVPWRKPVHEPGECPACDAWRLQAEEDSA